MTRNIAKTGLSASDCGNRFGRLGHRKLTAILISGIALASLSTGCSGTSGLSNLMSKAKTPQVNNYTAADAQTESPASVKDPKKLHLAYGQWEESQQNYIDARKSYQSALQKDPKSVDALLGLARLDELAGRHAEAKVTLEKAAKLGPKHPALLVAYANMYAKEDRWDLAVDSLRTAVDESPDDLNLRFQYATALARSGNIDDSLVEYTRAVGPANAHYNIAFILAEAGSDRAAMDHAQKALARSPGHVQARTLQARLRGEYQAENEQKALVVKSFDVRNSKAAFVPGSGQYQVEGATARAAVPAEPSIIPGRSSATPAPDSSLASDDRTPTSVVQPAGYAPTRGARAIQRPKGMSEAQFEQWQNQQTDVE
jgi:tetratricopeptide (TPR) repeat protein